MLKRKTHNASIKAKVAIEAIKGDKTTNELAGIYGVHPNLIGQWKKKMIGGIKRNIYKEGESSIKENRARARGFIPPNRRTYNGCGIP